jgi:hypothetical protein
VRGGLAGARASVSIACAAIAAGVACNSLLGHESPTLLAPDADDGEGAPADAGVTSDVPACDPDADHSLDPANCGACGHDCLGGGCLAGKCEPVMLASGQAYATKIAIDDDSVYWVNYQTSFAVMKIGKDGTCGNAHACPVQLAPTKGFLDVYYPSVVATDGTNVYWSNYDGNCTDQTIYQVRTDGTSFVRLGSLPCGAAGLSVAGGSVYWARGTVFRAPPGSMDAGAVVALPPADAGTASTVFSVLADATHVYFTTYEDGFLYGVPLGSSCSEGASCAVLVTGDTPSGPVGLTMAGDYLYWTNVADGTIKRVPKAGGTRTVIATGQGYAQAITNDGVNLYWANFVDSTVRTAPLSAEKACDASTCTILASGQQLPSGIAVDDKAIYWTTQTMTVSMPSNTGTVMKLAK